MLVWNLTQAIECGILFSCHCELVQLWSHNSVWLRFERQAQNNVKIFVDINLMYNLPNIPSPNSRIPHKRISDSHVTIWRRDREWGIETERGQPLVHGWKKKKKWIIIQKFIGLLICCRITVMKHLMSEIKFWMARSELFLIKAWIHSSKMLLPIYHQYMLLLCVKCNLLL